MTAPAAGECDVWWVRVGPHDRWADLLDAGEHEQAARYRVEHARATFVTSRAVQRLVGALYLGIGAREVRIERTCAHCGAGHGRPRFARADASVAAATDIATARPTLPAGQAPHVAQAQQEHQAQQVDYSVSHTQAWVVIAVVGTGLIGADIESTARPHSREDLARSVLTPAEQRLLAGVPEAARDGEFLRLWTRKEATVKLTGHGLAAPVDRIDVSGPIAEAGVGAARAGWPREAIHLFDAPGRDAHVLSLASTVPIRAVKTRDSRTELVPTPTGPE